eukprot:973050-Pelagomonas_calceolata.AAC.2
MAEVLLTQHFCGQAQHIVHSSLVLAPRPSLQVTARWLSCCLRSTSVGKRNTCIGLLAKLLARIKAAAGSCSTRCVRPHDPCEGDDMTSHTLISLCTQAMYTIHLQHVGVAAPEQHDGWGIVMVELKSGLKC